MCRPTYPPGRDVITESPHAMEYSLTKIIFTAFGKLLLNWFLFFATQWTNENWSFSFFEHVFLIFQRDGYNEYQNFTSVFFFWL